MTSENGAWATAGGGGVLGMRKPVSALTCPSGPGPASHLKLSVSLFTLSKTVAPPSVSLPLPQGRGARGWMGGRRSAGGACISRNA